MVDDITKRHHAGFLQSKPESKVMVITHYLHELQLKYRSGKYTEQTVLKTLKKLINNSGGKHKEKS